MITATVNIGATKQLQFTFKDINETLADPSSIALTIREPDGVSIAKTDADMTNPSTGLWTYDHPVTKAGRHYAYADGDGAVDAAIEFEFWGIRKTA